jgi:O-antigen ligase
MLTAMRLAAVSNLEIERKYFERLSYFISIYALLQAADLDPIDWSQKQMVSTLGNINFMSSFLGMACISFFSRTIFESLSITSKVHYGIFLSLNLFLIILSKSIQGIGVLLAGMVIVIAFQIRRKLGPFGTFAFVICSFFFGVLVFMGTAGFGPLSALRQETVVYRIDYWLAGLAMTKSNPLNGVGIDSYGDFYQQYRNLDAVVRTGPQRVTNTAHNIFLDVSSGSGIIAGLAFIGVFLIATLKIIQCLRDDRCTSNQVVFASMYIGFIVFCMISINQIGVGVWGFIFLGFVLGSTSHNMEIQSTKKFPSRIPKVGKLKESSLINKNDVSSSHLVFSITIMLIGAVSVYIPNQIDAKIWKAAKQRDLTAMKAIASKESAAVFYRNQYQSFILEAGQQESALAFARAEISRNDRNEISWRILAFSELSTSLEKERAVKSLVAMDPRNDFLRQELKDINKGGS